MSAEEVGSAATMLAASSDAASAPTEPGRPRDAAPTSAFAAGARVAERYLVRRFIARGGMGEVYEVTDAVLDTRVALKTLRADLASDAEAVARFRREVLVARQVTHPGVCRVFDYGLHGESIAFLTMELLDGETLDQRLQKRGRFRPDEVRDLARQLGAALGAAHRAGIVHRDFKSANIFLVPGQTAERPRAVITDFGLAFAAGGARLTSSTGAMMSGTPAYMAPEQVEGQPQITGAADLYALGVVLFELCTGQLPFVADSAAATALMRLTRSPPVPSTLVPGLPAVWDTVILRCLARQPADRYASPEEVVAALDAPAGARPADPGQLGLAPTLQQPVAAAASRARPTWRGWWRPAAIALLVGAAFALGQLLPGTPGPAPTSPPLRASTPTPPRAPARTPAAPTAEVEARARALRDQGEASLARADLPGADRSYQAALALPGLAPQRRVVLLAERGATLFQDGRAEAGEQHLRQALTLARSLRHGAATIAILGNLAEVVDHRGRSSEAHALMREQFPLYGEVRNNAVALRVITRGQIAAGRGHEASITARVALGRARQEKDPDDLILARALLFRAEALWLGKVDLKELATLRADLVRLVRPVPGAMPGPGLLARWEAALECARALVALPAPATQERKAARELIVWVRAVAPPPARLLNLKLRLTAHELSRAEGRLVVARVTALAEEATRLGYLRIAGRARALATTR